MGRREDISSWMRQTKNPSPPGGVTQAMGSAHSGNSGGCPDTALMRLAAEKIRSLMFMVIFEGRFIFEIIVWFAL